MCGCPPRGLALLNVAGVVEDSAQPAQPAPRVQPWYKPLVKALVTRVARTVMFFGFVQAKQVRG